MRGRCGPCPSRPAPERIEGAIVEYGPDRSDACRRRAGYAYEAAGVPVPLWADGSARVAAAERLDVASAVALARRGRGTPRRPPTGWDSLTPAERQIALLVAEGFSNPDIAERLFVSRATVKTHLAHAFTKLDVISRAARCDGSTPVCRAVTPPPAGMATTLLLMQGERGATTRDHREIVGITVDAGHGTAAHRVRGRARPQAPRWIT